jgi:hypothetical protein
MGKKKDSDIIGLKIMIFTPVIGTMIRCMEWVSINMTMVINHKDIFILDSLAKENVMESAN